MFGALVCVGITIGEALFVPGGVDWRESFRPAALAMLAGRSPYEVASFFNPFWTLVVLAPLCALPVAWGYGVLFTANLLGYVAVLRHCPSTSAGTPPLRTAAGGQGRALPVQWIWIVVFVVTSGALLNSQNANIEGLVALGLILPRPVGMLFLLMKPQLGAGVALVWTWEAWRAERWRGVARLLWPTAILSAISVGLYGLWFLHAPSVVDMWWNRSIFPFGVSLGVYCLWLALRDHDTGWAVAAGPLMSPYLAPHSWAFAAMGMLLATVGKREVTKVKSGKT